MDLLAKILTSFTLFILLLVSSEITAQHCLSDIVMQENLSHEHVLRNRIEVEKTINKSLQNPVHAQSREVYTIPVVFHVIWNKEHENISDERIHSQLDVLNDDFRNQNGFSSKIPAEFRDLAVDCEIEFCLANRTPEGNPTDGIIRVETVFNSIGTLKEISGRRRVFYNQYGGSDSWDPESYLNIVVCDIGDDILGFSSYPGSPQFPEEDGIVIDYLYFGTINNPGAEPYDQGRTLTHEAGHFFNLYHPWGPYAESGCDEDDQVADTPLQSEIYYNCPHGPRTSCGSSDMFMNFMNYTPDECLLLFTPGQKARMVATMQGPRKKLLESQGCQPSDGTDDLNNILVYSINETNEIIMWSEIYFRENVDYRLYTIDGKLTFNGSTNGFHIISLDSSQLMPGIYILKMISGDNRRSVKLFII